MTKILGLDLGTNSIGWALRDSDAESENQIIDKGVIVFKKGVGDGKSGEYSLAAERRTNRSKRRLYNAKRYRKWATLKVLSENGMCPLTNEELRLWSIGNWKEIDGKLKNKGRLYPSSPDFIAWLAMDFERIGKQVDVDVKLKPAFNNIYELRVNLLENYNDADTLRLYKIGRAFYHLVQRRGFKTSRKSGKSAYGNNEYLEEKLKENPEWKTAQILQHGLTEENRRIRNSGVIQRKYFEDEFYSICEKQILDESLISRIFKAIYFVRPLRTQKGLVGKCTLEKGKTRIPISHPMFEEFRALAFINNIQWRGVNSNQTYESIPIKLKKDILEKVFFRRLTKGKNKDKVNLESSFPFEDIIETFSDKGKWEFNYRNKPNVSSCPVIAGLMNVFDDTWKDKFITDENRFGINWDGLTLDYTIKYGNKEKVGQKRELNYIEIWHLLFDYIQTKDDEEALSKFCKEVIGWDEIKTQEFVDINISQGYGSLSQTAIKKILPFLQEGNIYSDAVSFANLSSVLGKELFDKNKNEIKSSVSNTIKSIDSTKEKLNIVNGLIQQYFAENPTTRAKGVDNHIKEMAYEDTLKKLRDYFGEEVWNSKSEVIRKEYADFVFEKYLSFLDGKQTDEVKASGNKAKKAVIDYYKLPRVDEAIKEVLKTKYNATDTNLKKMYHPSDIEVYPNAIFDTHKRVYQLGNPMPPSKGFKNPMAMRTLYELRMLINYLLETKDEHGNHKIDADTKIVIELARELNDANKRWAIETYQRFREEENKEFAKAILGVAQEKYPDLKEDDANNIDKVRLWWEQLENGEEIYKSIKALKTDVEKYRLWKEQGCQCLYTGKIIKITDLFDGTSFDFEHTLPLSKSFDNSFVNLTICDSTYNRSIKKNRMPSELENYENEANGYPAIKPKLDKWIAKAKSLEDRIRKNKIDTKKAISSGNTEYKNELIKKRHLLQFDFDYWNKKVQTFTLTEMPSWWKNSQLIDTQIVSKYARAYMKTLFNKVDVQKGITTSEFKKIYQIKGDEKKDRSKHSHHAMDAAVLTLIPSSAKREAILKLHYEAIENKQKYHTKPYDTFDIKHILDIQDSILINHVSKDQTLVEAKKKVRKRGKVEFLRDKVTRHYLKSEKGKAIPKLMQGDAIRGQLFKETFFGAIKVVERDSNGFAQKDENKKYIIKKDKNGIEQIKYVVREPLVYKTSPTSPGFKSLKELESQIVDTVLFKMIASQVGDKDFKTALEDGIYMINNKSNKENKIRHVRIYVSVNPVSIKKHNDVFLSTSNHKENYYAETGDNYLYLLYEGTVNKNIKRKFISYKLIDVAKNKVEGNLKINDEYKINEQVSLPLRAVIKIGTALLLFENNIDELKDLDKIELFKRLVYVKKFRSDDGRIYFQNHIEARDNDSIKKEFGDFSSKLEFGKYIPWNVLSPSNFQFAIEGYDFIIKPDGMIEWLF